MADWNPWYTTGTVSLANGGTTVTGVGTSFNAAGIRIGDLFTNAAMTAWAVVTAAPTTPTGLAVSAWGGATLAAGSNYRIWRISDADRMIAASADLMTAMVPNLMALGALPGAANKLPYFAGAGSLALADLTAAARTLLAAPTSRGGLDILTAGVINIASAATTNIGSVDAPGITITGTETISSFGPGAAGALRILVFAGGATLVHSANLILPGGANILAETSDTAIFTSLGGSAWRCLSYGRRGYPPTGMTTGTVAGAQWLRLGAASGGVQICWGKHARTGVAANLASPAFYRTASQGRSFPAAFASADVAVGAYVFPDTGGQYDIWASQAVAQSNTTFSYVVLSGTSRASIGWTEYWWALGRY